MRLPHAAIARGKRAPLRENREKRDCMDTQSEVPPGGPASASRNGPRIVLKGVCSLRVIHCVRDLGKTTLARLTAGSSERNVYTSRFSECRCFSTLHASTKARRWSRNSLRRVAFSASLSAVLQCVYNP